MESLDLDVYNTCDFLEKHQLTVTSDQLEFITFQPTNKNKKYKNTNLIVKDEIKCSTSTINFLGAYLDQNLTFQEEVKSILRIIARGVNERLFSWKSSFTAIECPCSQSSPLLGNSVE